MKTAELILAPKGCSGLAGFRVVEDIQVPPGKYFANPIDHTIRVNPASMEQFLNLLRAAFDDQDGERSFPA